jgi:hypothetical protein
LALLALSTFPFLGGLVGRFRAALPLGVFAPAVLRRPPALRAVAVAPAPRLRLDGVRFCPLLFVRGRVFLAMASIPANASVEIDGMALSDVSSIAYREQAIPDISPPELRSRHSSIEED